MFISTHPLQCYHIKKKLLSPSTSYLSTTPFILMRLHQQVTIDNKKIYMHIIKPVYLAKFPFPIFEMINRVYKIEFMKINLQNHLPLKLLEKFKLLSV